MCVFHVNKCKVDTHIHTNFPDKSNLCKTNCAPAFSWCTTGLKSSNKIHVNYLCTKWTKCITSQTLTYIYCTCLLMFNCLHFISLDYLHSYHVQLHICTYMYVHYTWLNCLYGSIGSIILGFTSY